MDLTDKNYMLYRLIFPLIAFILFIISKEVVLAGFFAGYLLCWVFSYLKFIKLKDKTPKQKGRKK